MTVEMCAPVRPEVFAIEAEVVRSGNSVTSASAEMTQDGGNVAKALATFASSRDTVDDFDRSEPPEVPEPSELEPVHTDVMPTFAHHFDFRFAVGQFPMMGAEEARIGGWLRLHESHGLDARLAAALLDAYPPAVMARFESMRPVSTIQMSVFLPHDFRDLDYADDAFFLVEETCEISHDGYCEERASVWGADGRLIAQGRQMMAILG